jgi:Trypsin-like peptidase domain/FHA domain
MVRKDVLATLLLIPLFLGLSSSNAQAEDTAELLLWKIKPATVLVYFVVKAEITIGKGKYKSDTGGSGSGFIISPDGYVVTNGHVVELYHESNEQRLKADLINKVIAEYIIPSLKRPLSDAEKQQLSNELFKRARFDIEKHLYVFLQNGDYYPAEIKSYSPPIGKLGQKEAGKGYAARGEEELKIETGKDVSVMKIEAANLPVAKLGDSEAVRLAETIYAVGFPGVVLGHEYLSKKTIFDPTVTTGRVSGAKLDIKGTKVIQTDASVAHGNSGGPAYNSKGEVVGLVTFGGGEPGVPGLVQGFNFLVPINTAKEFVRSGGVELGKESLFNKAWAETIDLYAKGKYKEAISKADEVLRFFPNLPDAKNLQVRAQEEIMKLTSKGGGGVLPYTKIILIIVMLGIAGGIGFVLLRKKKPVPISSPLGAKTQAATVVGSIKGKSGPFAGKSFDVPSTGLKIGREPGRNTLVIDDERVSREHVWIGQEGGKVLVRDLNSLNGTFLNNPEGSRIKEEALKDGDIIIIGKGDFASFIYKAGS